MERSVEDAGNLALPGPPPLTLQLQNLLNTPGETAVDTALDLLRHHPTISSKLLWIANAPSYAHGRQINDLRAAICAMGIDHFALLAQGLSLKDGLPDLNRRDLTTAELWKHFVATAVACRAISRFLGTSNDETAFMCGLVSRIGQVVLLASDRSELAAIDDRLPSAELEQRQWGVTHHEVSRDLLHRWQMHPTLCDVAACWGDVSQIVQAPAAVQRLASMVRLADEFRKLLFCENKAAQLQQMHFVGGSSFGLSNREIDRVFTACQSGLYERLSVFLGSLDEEIDCRAILAKAEKQLGAAADAAYPRPDHRQRPQQPKINRSPAIDPLTGLPNRDDLDAELAALDQWSIPRPYSIVMLGVDQLDKSNDKYGRAAGDAILEVVAKKVLAAVRDTDFAARYGGHQFAVILPFADSEKAAKVADRLVALVQFSRVDVGPDVSVYPTVSCGVASSMDVQEQKLGTDFPAERAMPGTADVPISVMSRPDLETASSQEILRRAGLALAQAAKQGPHAIVHYSESVGKVSNHKLPSLTAAGEEAAWG